MTDTEGNLKSTSPHTDAPQRQAGRQAADIDHVDLDFKRPGRIERHTRASVLRGAVAGPPARPGGKSD